MSKLNRRYRAAVVATAMLAAGTAAAYAEVRVQGDAAALRIDAKQSRVAEILSALGPALNVRVHASIPVDQVISGTYEGSLRRVLSLVLNGYNYVLKTRGTEVEVIVYSARGDRAIVGAPPTPPPAKSLAAQWRSSPNKTTPQAKP